ncbi:MAG: hypothetical protein AAF098_04215, partial [Pseudomonadota bacterium]
SYDGVCLVDQREGRLLRTHPVPPWKVLIVVPKTRIATEEVQPYAHRYCAEYDEVFETVSGKASEADLLSCIELSASTNARLRNYQFYFAVRRFAQGFHADAVGVAHTGSLVTVFFRDAAQYDEQAPALARTLQSQLPLDALLSAELTAQSWAWCSEHRPQPAADGSDAVLAASSSPSTSTALST